VLSALAITALLAAAPGGPPKAAYVLPLPAATEWQVLVFAAYVPEAERDQPVPYEIDVRYAQGGDQRTQLQGQVKWLQTDRLKLALPAGCEGFSLTLRWAAQRLACDLDLGLEQVGTGLKLAPLFTTLRSERLTYTADTLPFYQWLTSTYGEWWRGYPFWAERPGGRGVQ